MWCNWEQNKSLTLSFMSFLNHQFKAFLHFSIWPSEKLLICLEECNRLEPWCSGSDQPLHCGPWGTHCSETSPVPITSVHNLNCLPLQSYFYLIDLCHFTSISNLISSSKLHNTQKIYLISAFYESRPLPLEKTLKKILSLSHACICCQLVLAFTMALALKTALGLRFP